MSTNPFDDGNGAFFVRSTTKTSTACGRCSPISPAGWRVVRSEAANACLYVERTGPICSRRACVTPWPKD